MNSLYVPFSASGLRLLAWDHQGFQAEHPTETYCASYQGARSSAIELACTACACYSARSSCCWPSITAEACTVAQASFTAPFDATTPAFVAPRPERAVAQRTDYLKAEDDATNSDPSQLSGGALAGPFTAVELVCKG